MIEWRQNLNRVYKKISPQKMSPSHSSETQTATNLKFRLAVWFTPIAFLAIFSANTIHPRTTLIIGGSGELFLY